MSRSAAVWRWVREQFAFLVVLVGLGGSFGYLVLEPTHWVRGTAALAVVAVLAALVRAAVPTPHVGMLAVRSRWLDTVLYLASGAATFATAVTIWLRS